MKTAEFIELVYRMRNAQRHYYRLDPRTERDKKTEALVSAKIVERQVDQVLADLEAGTPLEGVQIKPAEPWKKR